LTKSSDAVRIGIDVGGTHTDLIAIRGERIVRAKALTTHERYSDGIVETLKDAAAQLDSDLNELLGAKTRAFVNGNTIVTNAIAELKGCRVGVLVTRGFAGVLHFGRGNRTNIRDDHLQRNLPQLVPRERIFEIDERIDSEGQVVVPLRESEVKAATERLIEMAVDAIAVCFLWSPASDRHERQAEVWVREVAPEVFVTPSFRVAPVFREFERWMTAVLNCYVQPPVESFVSTVTEKLGALGYRGQVEFFNGLGGVLSEEEVHELPIELYSSGPAGGAIGSAALARRYEAETILCGDMGGTSFDTTLIKGFAPTVAQRCRIGSFDTAVSLLDIVSIGAGGGSIISLDPRGVPQVGPQSAGSMPGPVCYGRGGKLPTVTDCMVVMGFIDPDNYLGGSFRLDIAAASVAVDEHVARSMGWDPLRAAAGACSLAVVSMANALRQVSVKRGHDVRRAIFVAYGGALPLFAADIARQLGIGQVIVPGQSSAFSAYGLLEADYVSRDAATIGWVLGDDENFAHTLTMRDKTVERVTAAIERAGLGDAVTQIRHGANFRYVGQLNDMYIPLAPDDLGDPGLRAKFDAAYESEFGTGTAWHEARLQLVNYSVMGIAARPKPTIMPVPAPEHTASEGFKGTRRVYLPDRRDWIDMATYDAEGMAPGAHFEGPGIVDVCDTTIYVPAGARIERDAFENFRLTL
jgi:N-methylhydantoinase A